MKVAFIGLGNMGLPMAKNLLQGGFAVHAYNRSFERSNALRDTSVKIFDTAEKAVEDADVVISMLSDDHAVKEISDRIIPVMKKGSIHLSMSTVAPSTATKLSESATKNQIIYLGSPVMGRPPAAEAKQLFILLSGDSQAKTKVKPILEAMSQRVFDYGDNSASANTVKLIMNYMIFVVVEILSEVMLVAEKAGIDKKILLETMTSTIFGAPAIKTYGALIIEEKDNPKGFSTKLASKDLRLMQEAASQEQIILPLADVIQAHFKEIISNEGGHKDVSHLVTHLREALKK
jgi:3-hydroxyisobutyrate dehydrogenase-like beta-hydroxyacid dehydrogenase